MEIPQNELADSQPDFGGLLPREVFLEIVLVLRGALPPPLTDDPANLARRDRAAMAAVAALLPTNGVEGRLAAQFVAADAWAMDCLRLAGERARELGVAGKCRAQAMSLMREGKAALRVLLRLQAIRQKIEGNDETASRAAWVEHCAAGMMNEALMEREANDDPPPPSPANTARDGRAENLAKASIILGSISRQAISSPEKHFETGLRYRPVAVRVAA